MAVEQPVSLPFTILESSVSAPEATRERMMNWWGYWVAYRARDRGGDAGGVKLTRVLLLPRAAFEAV